MADVIRSHILARTPHDVDLPACLQMGNVFI